MLKSVTAIKGQRVRVYIKDVCVWIGKLTYRNGLYYVTTDASIQVSFQLTEISHLIIWGGLLPEIHLTGYSVGALQNGV